MSMYDILASGHIDFGFKDARGRKVGCSWRLRQDWAYTGELVNHGSSSSYATTLIDGFVVVVQPTRDGVSYGASQNDTRGQADLDAAFKTICRKASAYRKSQAKKFG